MEQFKMVLRVLESRLYSLELETVNLDMII